MQRFSTLLVRWSSNGAEAAAERTLSRRKQLGKEEYNQTTRIEPTTKMGGLANKNTNETRM